MKIVRFSELGDDVREEMKGARWILLHQDEIQDALGALMFAEPVSYTHLRAHET